MAGTQKSRGKEKPTERIPAQTLPASQTEVFEGLQTSLVDKLKDVMGTLIDEKLNEKFMKMDELRVKRNDAETAQPQSYASAISKDHQVQNFRNVVAAAKNEDLAEEREKSLRQNNIIIHGCEEADLEHEVKDKEFFDKFINDLVVGTVVTKSIIRIGQKSNGKKRPIKVTLSNTSDKDKIISNLRNLKDKGYSGISITEDYTIAERGMINDFKEKAKSANGQLSAESDKIWVVRGNPKNGLFLKQVTKRTTRETTEVSSL